MCVGLDWLCISHNNIALQVKNETISHVEAGRAAEKVGKIENWYLIGSIFRTQNGRLWSGQSRATACAHGRFPAKPRGQKELAFMPLHTNVEAIGENLPCPPAVK